MNGRSVSRIGGGTFVQKLLDGRGSPCVRANRPAEASAVSPDCDDVAAGAGRAYGACRSGSG